MSESVTFDIEIDRVNLGVNKKSMGIRDPTSASLSPAHLSNTYDDKAPEEPTEYLLCLRPCACVGDENLDRPQSKCHAWSHGHSPDLGARLCVTTVYHRGTNVKILVKITTTPALPSTFGRKSATNQTTTRHELASHLAEVSEKFKMSD